MTKTTAPKAPRLTKAQKLAMIELETQAIESQIAVEKGEEYVPPVVVDVETLTIVSADMSTTIVTEAPKTNDEAEHTPIENNAFKTPKTVKTGVGSRILELIAEGKLSNKEIVAKVLEENPMRKTTYACVAWYKSQVKANKIDLPKVEEVTQE